MLLADEGESLVDADLAMVDHALKGNWWGN
jgi:hypothetical protein